MQGAVEGFFFFLSVCCHHVSHLGQAGWRSPLRKADWMENKAGRVGPLDFAPTAVVPFYFLLLHFVVESSAQRQTEVKLRDDLDATDEKKVLSQTDSMDASVRRNEGEHEQ